MIKGELKAGDGIKIAVIYLREPDALRLDENYVREENGKAVCALKVLDIDKNYVLLEQVIPFGDKDVNGIIIPLKTVLDHGDMLISTKEIEDMYADIGSQLQGKHTEQVSHPAHYTWLKDLCGVEPLDICQHLDFCCGSAIKYILRRGKEEKNLTEKQQRIQNLEKAKVYIETEIKLLKDGKE